MPMGFSTGPLGAQFVNNSTGIAGSNLFGQFSGLFQSHGSAGNNTANGDNLPGGFMSSPSYAAAQAQAQAQQQHQGPSGLDAASLMMFAASSQIGSMAGMSAGLLHGNNVCGGISAADANAVAASLPGDSSSSNNAAATSVSLLSALNAGSQPL
ncbi:hypothetical protein LPJ66_011844 [Kickxella alabastrina]|uniref:Uncharacterized protein n=1 Tax=Kickxella alabastrina TaxID=61397 RepID=A0ACC1HZ23_9FUNG|nr:hypothetical protein LPJ66_011844 [Kickxella alabastrina]